MNPDVKGDFKNKAADKFVEEDLELLKTYSLVIVDHLSFVRNSLYLKINSPFLKDFAIKVNKICVENDISLVVLKSHGMIGYIRLFKNTYATCETKEEGERFDLRITNPFPELLELANTYNLDELEKVDHKFVPFIVILIKELEKWKQAVSSLFNLVL